MRIARTIGPYAAASEGLPHNPLFSILNPSETPAKGCSEKERILISFLADCWSGTYLFSPLLTVAASPGFFKVIRQLLTGFLYW